MNRIITTLLAVALPALSFAQNGPIDFETGGEGATWTWTVFENDLNPALEIIPNPDQTGINPSATVAKFTALQAGQPWAGCESLHGSDIGPFFIDSSNAQITIMVWKSVISDVGIKLVRPDGWSLGEIKVANTKINEWEEITFDFSAHIGLAPAYDQIVIFPDFDIRAADQVVYFDNVFGFDAVTSVKETVLSKAKIYPNPGQTNFRIESQTTIHELRVYNLFGELVKTLKVEGLNAEVDAGELSNGVYVIQVDKDDTIEIFSWIKN